MAGFAPYNFIPFSLNKVPVPYAAKEELPKFNEPCEEYTGRIDYEIHNLTGISVGGNKERPKDKKEVTDGVFCVDGRGNFVIPGSTVRGFFRNHVEILSASYPEMIEDEQYLFRKFADKCKSVREEYSAKLKASQGSSLRIPDGVKAGYIYKEKQNGKEVYYIMPAKPFGEHATTFFRVHERDLRLANALPTECYMYNELIDKYHGNGSEASKREYNSRIRKKKNKNYQPYRGVPVTFDFTAKICNVGKGTMKGILLNSAWIDGKTHHYIVSAEKGTTSFEVPREAIVAYRNDNEKNKALEGQEDFYALPTDPGIANAKLFFYKKDGKGKEKLVGFGPTPYFRVLYDKTTLDGIRVNKPSGYDYAHSLFGYATASDAYKSRLNFSNCVIQDKSVTAKQVGIYAGGPKGTAFQLYLEQAGRTIENLHTYNNSSMRLRGYKFYWKRSKPVGGCMEGVAENTRIAVVPENNVFKGCIHYENLNREELGLLLSALKVSDNVKETYQIGNAKEYGYGKIEIQNVKLYQIDPKQRFTGLNVEEKNISDQIPELKKYYRTYFKEQYGINIETDASMSVYTKLAQMENADEYLASHAQQYMVLGEYRNREILPMAEEVLSKKWKAAPAKSVPTTQARNASDGPVCLWIAGYNLYWKQEKALLNKLPDGTKIVQIKEWVKAADIEKYAKQYRMIALSWKSGDGTIKEAKNKFDKVFVSVAGADGYDHGWQEK